VVFPLHPRTDFYLKNYNLHATIASNESLRLIDPLDYPDMAMLEKNAATILTDSGGIQKEAFFFCKPCITMRDSTEWVELVNSGWNTLTGAYTENIITAVKNIHIPENYPSYMVMVIVLRK
jgi:UDP-GlcNAc3NAcA epimerase